VSFFGNTIADAITAKSFERQKSAKADIAECAVAMSQSEPERPPAAAGRMQE
jgi:hypothetical protein